MPKRQRMNPIAGGGGQAVARTSGEERSDEPSVDPVETQSCTSGICGYVPFPVELLPPTISLFVQETTRAMGCDPAYVALPVLSVLGASIGATRTIELRPDWREPSVIWTVVIAPSGCKKSPAWQKAVAPLEAAQRRAFRLHESRMAVHRAAGLRYEKELKQWSNGKAMGTDPPKQPEAPVCVRYVVADTTTEALVPILKENPRGVLQARDEQAGWVGGFNQYKSGQGSDVQTWLEFWRAGSATSDRRGGGTIHIPRAAVSVCGTIQPETFARVMTRALFESGLPARLLAARPVVQPGLWTDDAPSPAALLGYERVVLALLTLQHAQSEDGLEPIPLRLSGPARAVWVPWHDAQAWRTHVAGEVDEAAALAKLTAYAARFALIFELVLNPAARAVSADSMKRGTELADWFSHEAARVYGRLSEDHETRRRRTLIEWIGRLGGKVTVRDVCRGSRKYPSTEEAETALGELVDARIGKWEEVSPGRRGGRPSRVFRLCLDADET